MYNPRSNTQAGREVKYFRVAFMSDKGQDEELDTQIGKASAVVHALHHAVIMKRDESKKNKALNFQNSFCPHCQPWS